MENRLLIAFMFLMVSCISQGQTSTYEKEVKEALTGYLKAGDTNDSKSLENYMHESFRVSHFDGDEGAVKTLDRLTYRTLIGNRTFGGYPRKAKYEFINFIGDSMASVQVTLTSPGKPTLRNFYSMVKLSGKWFVLQDFVTLEK